MFPPAIPGLRSEFSSRRGGKGGTLGGGAVGGGRSCCHAKFFLPGGQNVWRGGGPPGKPGENLPQAQGARAKKNRGPKGGLEGGRKKRGGGPGRGPDQYPAGGEFPAGGGGGGE